MAGSWILELFHQQLEWIRGSKAVLEIQILMNEMRPKLQEAETMA